MTHLHDITPLLAGSDWDGAGWFPFAILWLVLIATVAFLVVRTARRPTPSGPERAREILAERYARGEIGAEEYRERLDELGRSQ